MKRFLGNSLRAFSILSALALGQSACHGVQEFVDLPGSETRLYGYTTEELKAFGRIAGSSTPRSALSSRRSASGNELYFTESGDNRTEVFYCDASGKTHRKPVGEGDVWLGADLSPIVRFDRRARHYSFANGSVMAANWVSARYSDGSTHQLLGTFAVSSSGKYFLSEAGDKIEICRTDAPQSSLLSIDAHDVENWVKRETELVETDEGLILWRLGYNRCRERSSKRCYFLTIENFILEGESLSKVRRVTYNTPFTRRSTAPIIGDIDPEGRFVAILDWKDDPFGFANNWYVFDVNSQEWLRVGMGSAHSVYFLTDDLLRNAITFDVERKRSR